MRRVGQSLAVLITGQLVRFLKYIKYRMLNLQNRRLGYRFPEACKQREIFNQQDILCSVWRTSCQLVWHIIAFIEPLSVMQSKALSAFVRVVSS